MTEDSNDKDDHDGQSGAQSWNDITNSSQMIIDDKVMKSDESCSPKNVHKSPENDKDQDIDLNFSPIITKKPKPPSLVDEASSDSDGNVLSFSPLKSQLSKQPGTGMIGLNIEDDDGLMGKPSEFLVEESPIITKFTGQKFQLTNDGDLSNDEELLDVSYNYSPIISQRPKIAEVNSTKPLDKQDDEKLVLSNNLDDGAAIVFKDSDMEVRDSGVDRFEIFLKFIRICLVM